MRLCCLAIPVEGLFLEAKGIGSMFATPLPAAMSAVHAEARAAVLMSQCCC